MRASFEKQISIGEVVELNPESIGRQYRISEIEYVDISSVGSGVLFDTTKYKLAEAPDRAKRLVKNGDTILSTVRPNRRSFLLISNPLKNLVVSTGFAVLRATPKINPKFLYYSVTDPKFTNYLTANAKGVAYPAVDKEIIERGEIYLPPFRIQEKIASILSAYDDLIENNTRRIAILEEMAQMIYREWFVKFRFPGHEKVKMVDSPLGKIPEGWEVKKIKDFGEVITGKTPPKKNKKFYGEDVLFIKTPDMNGSVYVIETGDHLSETGAFSQKKKYIPRGSVLVSCIGTLGAVALTGVDSQTNQQINSIIPTDKINSFYLYIKCKSLTSELKALGSSGATMGNVNKQKFKGIDVLYSGEILLEKFGKFCEPTFNQILNLLRRTQVIRQTRDLLLPKLISGKLDVSDLDIEISESDGPELQASAGGIK